jgi:large subunit ribosomal protein L10
MKKNLKQEIITSLVKEFDQSEAAFIITCPKLDAISTQMLKKKLALGDGKMIIAKNTLLKRAAHDSQKINMLANNFKDQIAIVFAYRNASGVASIIKNNGYGTVIDVKAGIFDNALFSASRFEFLASIPSKEVLYAQLCGLLQSPIAQLAYVLQKASEKQQES